MCTVSEYRGFGIYSMNKTGDKMTLYTTWCQYGKLREQMLGPFSAPSQAPACVRVKTVDN
jgi:hypothetical protein